MPLLFKRNTATTLLGLWHIGESIEDLEQGYEIHPEEQKRYNQIKADQKKKQWLSVRLLLKELGGPGLSITYNPLGKPFLDPSPFTISISHTNDYAAVILDKTKNNTGIDIQQVTEKVERISGKFMNVEEMKSVSPANKIEQLIIYWAAKESLYKLYGQKELDFKKNMFVEPFDYEESGLIKAHILKENERKLYKLHYETLGDHKLVYILNEKN